MSNTSQDRISSPFALRQRLRRALWNTTWSLLGRPFPRARFGWKRWVLNLFGAQIHPSARVYGTAQIWAPWNLVMGPRSSIAEHVECYNVAPVTLEEGAIVSMGAFLCTAGHDVHDPDFPLVTAPIVLQRKAWVCAKAIVGMGVTVGESAVVALGAVAVKDVPADAIVGGNPAREIGRSRC